LVSKNKICAVILLTVGLVLASGDMAFATFEDGVKAYEKQDYKTAIKEWLPLARNNDTAAMRNLGHMYRRGLGVEVDAVQAVYWYQRAAERGFSRAQANLASMYLKGEGVDKDPKKATDWFIVAARAGHVISQYNLGLIYENGLAGPVSIPKAMAWYNIAAKAGHPKALEKLSLLVAKNPTADVDESVVKSKSAKSVVAEPVEQVKQTEPEQAKPEVVQADTTATVVAVKATTEELNPVIQPAAKTADPDKDADKSESSEPVAEVNKAEGILEPAKKTETIVKNEADDNEVAETIDVAEAPVIDPAVKDTISEVRKPEPVQIDEPEAKQVEPVKSASPPTDSSSQANTANVRSTLSVRERAERQLAHLRDKVKARDSAPVFQEALPQTEIKHSTATTTVAPAPVMKSDTRELAPTPQTATKVEAKKQVGLFTALQSLFTSGDTVEKAPESAKPDSSTGTTVTNVTPSENVAKVKQPAQAFSVDATTDTSKPDAQAIVVKNVETNKAQSAIKKTEIVPAASVATVNSSPQSVEPAAATVPVVVASVPAETTEQPVEKFDPKDLSGSGLTLDERLEMANLYYELQDYQQALVIWMPLAKAGHPDSQYHVGELFQKGQAVPVNRKRAYHWLSRAKRGGNANAGEALEQLEGTMTEMEIRQAKTIQ
jgi:TPR repeat protein